jgi:hypothetical protein
MSTIKLQLPRSGLLEQEHAGYLAIALGAKCWTLGIIRKGDEWSKTFRASL